MGATILVRQYRKAVEKTLLEVPAGGIDVGETPETAARRELLEETGFTADIIEPLASFYSSPGFCTERGYRVSGHGVDARRGSTGVRRDYPGYSRAVE